MHRYSLRSVQGKKATKAEQLQAKLAQKEGKTGPKKGKGREKSAYDTADNSKNESAADYADVSDGSLEA